MTTTICRALLLLVAASSWSCSDPASLNMPTGPSGALLGPSARGSDAPTAEPMRRAEEVSGGGTTCFLNDCLTYPGGRIDIAGPGGSLTSQYARGFQTIDDIYDFNPASGLNGTLVLVGSGRLSGQDGTMDLGVDRQNASVLIQLAFPGGIQKITGSAVPTFSLQSDGQCQSGQRLTTTFTLTLEYLGKTTVTDTHCTATA